MHRELVLLTALMGIAIVAFVLTRSAAASNRNMRRSDAAEWYRRGQQALDAGRSGEAVTALRRASSKDPDNRGYSLALASALVADHHDKAAEQVLLRVRDSQPELPEANLALARLEARRSDVTSATRDYQHALTGLWTADREDERRRVRFELVRFLLDHAQHSRALSELLVLGVTLPDTPAAHLQVGRLFLEAGDAQRALNHFQSVLRQEAGNVDALAGAGEASFKLGDYVRARRYLRVESADPHIRALRSLTDLVLNGDPLAPRLPRGERMRRLSAAVAQSHSALAACLARLPVDALSRPTLEARQAESTAFVTNVASMRGRQPSDVVEDGTDLAYRTERDVEAACGVTDPSDRALLLIGRRHGLDPQ